jgi:transitional endoplasmic reticulum ATPase
MLEDMDMTVATAPRGVTAAASGGAGSAEALPPLLPSQSVQLAQLARISSAAPVVLVESERGVGKTTLLKHFAASHGGLFVDRAALQPSWSTSTRTDRGSTSLEVLLDHLARTELLVLDDITMFGDETFFSAHPVFLGALLETATREGKRVVAGSAGVDRRLPLRRAASFIRRMSLDFLKTDDLAAFLTGHYGASAVAGINFEQVARHITLFDGYGLKRLVDILGPEFNLSTEQLVEQLEAIRGGTNVRVEEVEALDFATLPGTGHIAKALETHVILPFERPELAAELDIRPKRGVLLYGPPGTGKTSIGRALAHRMKGRFFLIDGSFPTEPPSAFFGMVNAVVEQAKRHAPCVLFIDDADMLFGIVHITGLARYLLTLLDGLESESNGQICVMMTAMNASRIPSPILRSGRVELWLSTKAPDQPTRADILRRWIGNDLPGTDAIDYDQIAALADGATPADLRRIIADARTFLAGDRMAGRPQRVAQSYLIDAVTDLVATRARMAAHLQDDSLRVGSLAEAAARRGA